MRPAVKKKLAIMAAASSGLLGLIGYPALKSVYPIKKQTTIVDDYVDLPTATADLTKEVTLPEAVGAGTDVPVDVSHWLLLSLLKSKRDIRRDRALDELAKRRRWNDAECLEIAQALDRQDVIKLARTADADIRLFLPPPSVAFIEQTLKSTKIEKIIKAILKEVSEQNESCSSCANFYTNLSLRVRPDSNILALSDINQLDTMRLESKRRKKSALYQDIIRLKAVLNNVICSEEQALSMVRSGILIALLYFRHKYKDDIQINSLLSQILANLTTYPSCREYVFTDGWIRTLSQYSRDSHLDLSLPAFKALANLDDDYRRKNGVYGNHIYLLSPVHREREESSYDVIFLHGLVGSIFKSWRQGSVVLDDFGGKVAMDGTTPTTELLPTGPADILPEELDSLSVSSNDKEERTNCWPKDWLSKDVPGIRILAVDYPTALSSWRTDCDLNKDTLKERANHVMKQLAAARVGDKPIIWVAHSMGGLLIKQILVSCDEYLEQNSTYDKEVSRQFKENMIKQTKGIVFYSVPHKGSNLDWIERKNLQKLLLLTTEVIELQKGSTVLLNLHDKFLKLANRDTTDIKFLSYAENSISVFGVNKVVQWKGYLVHEDSLHFDIGPVYKLSIDHAHTCKPHGRNAITYVKTLEFIKEIMPLQKETQEDDLLPFISYLI